MVAAAALGAGTASPASPSTPVCGRAPKAIPRPAMLGPLPTPRGYVYTAAKRRNGAAVVAGYSKGKLQDLRLVWRNTIIGGGRWKVDHDEQHGNTVLLTFQGFDDPSKGQVQLVEACKGRIVATLTVRFPS
jgi:hypothetical protein